MKKLLLLAMSSIPFLPLQAQKESDKAKSNAEVFSEKAGSLIQKEFEPAGTVARCKIEVVHYKDLINGNKMTALRFEYGINSRAAVLDADEVAGLLISLNTIKNNVLNTSPANYTEVNYRSRDGFSGGCFSEKGKWTPFLKLVSYDSDSFIQLSLDDFNKLITILQSAKAKM